MNEDSIAATSKIINTTIKKNIHDIAIEAFVFTVSMYDITMFVGRVNESIIVYAAFTRIIGDIIGKVIFQKVSQPVAPSIVQAS